MIIHCLIDGYSPTNHYLHGIEVVQDEMTNVISICFGVEIYLYLRKHLIVGSTSILQYLIY